MPASTYPFVISDPILRSCRHCRSRVAAPSMCLTHPRTCATCCSSRLKRACGLGPREVLPPWVGWTPEEIEAERIACAKIVRQLYGGEIAEEAERREGTREHEVALSSCAGILGEA